MSFSFLKKAEMLKRDSHVFFFGFVKTPVSVSVDVDVTVVVLKPLFVKSSLVK